MENNTKVAEELSASTTTFTEVKPNVESELEQLAKSHQPEDVAAAFFRMEKPRLKRMLENLSAKQMRRVLMCVCSYPFVDTEYNPRTEEEKNVATLVDRMLYQKSVMQLAFEIQKADEAAKKEQENQTKGENNG